MMTLLGRLLSEMSILFERRDRRKEERIIEDAKRICELHEEFFELMDEYTSFFLRVEKTHEKWDNWYSYKYNVSLLEDIDRELWQKTRDIDVGLLHSLFAEADCCRAYLVEEDMRRSLAHPPFLEEKQSRRLKAIYSDIARLMPRLPQAMEAKEVFGEDGRPPYEKSLKKERRIT